MAEKHPRVEPTHGWNTLVPLFWWPEQLEYEQIRQPVLFNISVRLCRRPRFWLRLRGIIGWMV